jgi:hypothetical protein
VLQTTVVQEMREMQLAHVAQESRSCNAIPVNDPDALLHVTTKPAADAIGVHPATLWRYYRKGLVTPARVTLGGQTRWDIADLKRQYDALQVQARVKRVRK